MSENVAFLVPVRRDNVELDLDAWLECYLADCEARGLTPRTLEWYRDRGSRVVGHLTALGVRYPTDVTRKVVSELFGRLRRFRPGAKPLEPQTILGYWQLGKGFLTFLIGEGAHPGPNPFDQFGKPRVPEKVMWAPSSEECLAMLRLPDRRTVMGLRDLVVLLLLFDTGLRISALRGIRVDVSIFATVGFGCSRRASGRGQSRSDSRPCAGCAATPPPLASDMKITSSQGGTVDPSAGNGSTRSSRHTLRLPAFDGAAYQLTTYAAPSRASSFATEATSNLFGNCLGTRRTQWSRDTRNSPPTSLQRRTGEPLQATIFASSSENGACWQTLGHSRSQPSVDGSRTERLVSASP